MLLKINDSFSLQKIGTPGKPQFIFVPGGPGLNYKYLSPVYNSFLTKYEIILVDHNSYLQEDPSEILKNWQKGLDWLVNNTKKPIWFAHSFGGMLIQSNKEIEKTAHKIILCSTSPNMDWANNLDLISINSTDKIKIDKSESLFQKFPSDENLKQAYLNWWPYYFSKDSFVSGNVLIEGCEFSSNSYKHGGNLFFQSYKTNFEFRNDNIFIMSGVFDRLTPISEFKQYPELTKAVVNIEKSYHFPWIENHVDFIKSLKKILL